MKKLLFGLLLLSACTTKKEEAEEIQTLEVSSPISIDTTIQQEFVADIHAVQNVEIRARVKGYLDRILVDEGKQVSKGQIMFTINSQEYVADLAREGGFEPSFGGIEGRGIDLSEYPLAGG